MDLTQLELPAGGRVLISDFDGTMTAHDFFERVRDRFPAPPEGDGWNRYVSGELTHFEALRETYSRVPCDEALALALARESIIDPQLGRAVERLSAAGWSVVVVSAGCSWYIERLLADQAVRVPLVTNPAVLDGAGLRMTLPVDSPFFSPDVGVDKLAVVRKLRETCDDIAFAGDGRPDLPPALEVAPDRRFARGWLARALSDRGEPFRPFDRWSQVAEMLLQDSQ